MAQLTVYGWIDPKGRFFSVDGYAAHHTAEESIKEANHIERSDYLWISNNCIHVSPQHMRLPDNDSLTEKQLDTLMQYADEFEAGKLTHDDLGNFGTTSWQHDNVKKCVEDAMQLLYAKV